MGTATNLIVHRLFSDRRILTAGAFQLLFVAGVASLKAAANALLIGRAGEQALPALYVWTAALTLALAWLVTRGGLTGRREQRPGRIALFWLPVVLVLYRGVALQIPYAVHALYLAAEVYATAVSVAYWGTVSDIFDARESRRAFALLGGCGMAGSILGGLGVRAASRVVSAQDLVPLAAITMLGCALVARRMRVPVEAAMPGRRSTLQIPNAANYLRTDAFPRLLGLLAVLLAVGTALVDYLFRARARATLPEAQLASLFGGLSIVIGTSALLFQLALTGPLLRRFGIFGYLLTAPLFALGGAALCVVSPALWPAYLLKAVEQAGALSINQTGLQLLYNPMPDDVRPAARATIDGFLKKSGTALGGALLLFVPLFGLTDRGVAVAGVLLAVCCVMVVTRLKRHYLRAIQERLTSHRGPEMTALALLDGTTRAALSNTLEEAVRSPGTTPLPRALAALELLGRDRHFDITPLINGLLLHPEERLRGLAARIAGEARDRSNAEAWGSVAARLAEMSATDARRPREAAILALPAVDAAVAALALPPLLRDADLGVRSATVAALWRVRTAAPAAKDALDILLSAGPEASSAQRRESAKLLGRLGDPSLAPKLVPYLSDPDPTVARLACTSAGELKSLQLVPTLLDRLAGHGSRREARRALIAYGDTVVPELSRLLDDRTQGLPLRFRLPRLLAAIGTPSAARALLFSNPIDDASLRVRIADALARLDGTNTRIPLDAPRLRQATERQLASYARHLEAFRSLQAALPTDALLLRMMSERLDQDLLISFRLLGLAAGDARSAIRLHARFCAGPQRERALASELAENLAPALASSLRPVLERYHRAPTSGSLAKDGWADHLLELSASRDPLLAAVARLTAEKRGLHVPGEAEIDPHLLDRVFSLQGVDLFANCTVDDLGALAQVTHEQRFAAGEIVYREGDPGDALYVILEGSIDILKAAERILTLKTKESFGETSLLDGNPRPATAVAASDVRLLVVERGDLLDLIADRSELLHGIFAALAKHLRDVLEATAAKNALKKSA